MFNIKSGVPNIVFKTLPGPKINRVELGGALGTVRLDFLKIVEIYFTYLKKDGKMYMLWNHV